MNPHPAPQVMPATVESLQKRLKTIYWGAVTGEVSNMIKFYNQLISSNLDLSEDVASLDCENFKMMFDVWTGGQRSNVFDRNDLKRQATELANERFDVDRAHRCARLVLQSSALLDIDILYEPAPRLYPSFAKGPPNVEIIRPQPSETTGPSDLQDVLIRGIYCSGCALLIRSPVYYECGRGCVDSESPNFLSTLLSNIKDGLRTSGAKQATKPFGCRLCSQCYAAHAGYGNCTQDHFHRVYHENPNVFDVTIESLKKFQTIIAKIEDEKYFEEEGASRTKRLVRTASKATRVYRKAASVLGPAAGLVLHQSAFALQHTKEIIETVVTPAGHFHLAMMFGPLILESGVPGTKRGVLISQRPLPTLLESAATSQALVKDGPGLNFVDCTVFYKDKDSKKRGFFNEYRRTSPRLTLMCMKRVYGGAFSGYMGSNQSTEAAVIKCFIDEAAKCKFKPSKKLSAQRNQLYRSAQKVTECLQEFLGNEVDKYLHRIAKLLMDKDTKMSWNTWRNNCQRLVNRLLSGNDFEYVFPRLPMDLASRLKEDEKTLFTWPRYLISFGNQGYGATTHQHDSVMGKYFERKHTDYDILEFLEAAYFRAPENFSKWLKQLTQIDTNSQEGGEIKEALDANEIWHKPLDVLSLLQFQFHSAAQKHFNFSGKPLTSEKWIENRLLLLRIHDIFASFTGSLGVALLAKFFREPSLISEVVIPKAFVFGNARPDEIIHIHQLSAFGTVYIQVQRDKQPDFSILNRDVGGVWWQTLSNTMQKRFILWTRHCLRALGINGVWRSVVIELVASYAQMVATNFTAWNTMPAGSALPIILPWIANGMISIVQHQDNWMTFHIGHFKFTHQLLRKTKNIRK